MIMTMFMFLVHTRASASLADGSQHDAPWVLVAPLLEAPGSERGKLKLITRLIHTTAVSNRWLCPRLSRKGDTVELLGSASTSLLLSLIDPRSSVNLVTYL